MAHLRFPPESHASVPGARPASELQSGTSVPEPSQGSHRMRPELGSPVAKSQASRRRALPGGALGLGATFSVYQLGGHPESRLLHTVAHG